MIKIKEKFTLNQYSNMLLNYFNNKSSWIEFEYFISLLSSETISYDQLGFILLYQNKNLNKKKRINKIIDFVYYTCINRDKETNNNYQKKFWLMLKPNELKYHDLLENKLINYYKIYDESNLYNFSKLMYDINEYNLIDSKENNEKLFVKLLKNMELGYPYIEFAENIKPFIIKIYTNDYKDIKIDFMDILIKSINFESIKFNRIDSYIKLKNYINSKIDKLKKIYKIINKINKKKELDKNKSIIDYIYNNNILNENNYIKRKIDNIFKNKLTKEKFTNYFNNNDLLSNNLVENIFLKLFLYNNKLNINYIPINNLGFDIIIMNCYNGILINEIENFLIPFTSNFILKIFSLFNINFINVNELKINQLINKETFEYIKTYNKYVNYLVKNLNIKFNKYNYLINKNIIKEILIT